MRVSGMRALAGVRWLAAALAALLVLAVAAPSAWADDAKPTVTLNEDKKTVVSSEGTTTSYRLGEAVVSGGASSYIAVQVDSGYFSPAATAPAGADVQGALDQDGVYVAGDSVGAGEMYEYVAFRSSDSTPSVLAAAVQEYLRGLTFSMSGDDTEQKVTVTVVNQPLKVTYNGKEYDVKTLFNGHGYAFIGGTTESWEYGYPDESDGSTTMNWDKAYAAAKSIKFFGEKGHLLTIESANEHNLIYNMAGNKPGWMGATRFTTADQARENADTFEINAHQDEQGYGTKWYWVTGPSAGTMILDQATAGEGGQPPAGVYTNWTNGEPNNSSNGGAFDTETGPNGEGCAQYGQGGQGQWNDIPYNDPRVQYNSGFYVEFEDYSIGDAGSEVSATMQRVNVSYDLDDGKVTSSTTAVKSLKDVEYSTTLGAVAGYKLNASSVKVTVGGRELAAGTGYTFDSSTGKLKIPADKVTGDVVVSARVTRQAISEYDITYDTNGGTLPADAPKKHTYGTETKLPTPTRDGYTFDGWYDENGKKIDTIPADAKGTKVTAKWSANEYDITYDPDGGTLPADAPKKHTYGTETKLPTPTRDGYTFDGWYDEDGNKVDTIPADAKGMKVTARWTKNADNSNTDNSNTDSNSTDNGNGGTTYDPNGGTMPEGWTGADGRLPVPTRDGYRFDGWYDEDGNLVTSLEDAAGKTLHARWAKLDTLASTGATALAVGLTALALSAAGVTVAALRRRRSR